jgi:hypothetical protein
MVSVSPDVDEEGMLTPLQSTQGGESMRRWPRPTYANVTATLALVVALSGVSFAALGGFTDSHGVIHGCVKKRTGVLRVLRRGQRCNSRTEVALAWNQQGPRGAAGPRGDAGAPGAVGGGGAVASHWYRDSDGDGYGDWYIRLDSPAQPDGYVANNDDCNDHSATTHPGAAEVPNNREDENCDGVVTRTHVWCPDFDGDGYAPEAYQDPTEANPPSECKEQVDQPAGDVDLFGDCNDKNASITPYSGCGEADVDGDGHRATTAAGDDCDDNDLQMYPGNTERLMDGANNDCDPYTLDILPYDSNYGLPPRMPEGHYTFERTYCGPAYCVVAPLSG